MATLYVENVPDDVYKALRQRAKNNRTSITTEVIALLKQHVPTEEELRQRRKLFHELERLRSIPSPGSSAFPSTEEVMREDRDR